VLFAWMLKLKRTTVAGEPVDNIVENMCRVTCRARRAASSGSGAAGTGTPEMPTGCGWHLAFLCDLCLLREKTLPSTYMALDAVAPAAPEACMAAGCWS
jgi:hypothetical protein